MDISRTLLQLIEPLDRSCVGLESSCSTNGLESSRSARDLCSGGSLLAGISGPKIPQLSDVKGVAYIFVLSFACIHTMDPRILVALTIVVGVWVTREPLGNILLRLLVKALEVRRAIRAIATSQICVLAGAGRFATPFGSVIMWARTPEDNDAFVHLASIFAYCGGDQSPRNASLRAYDGSGYVLMQLGPHQYTWWFREGRPPVISTPGAINRAIPLIGSFTLPSASPEKLTKTQQRARRANLLKLVNVGSSNGD